MMLINPSQEDWTRGNRRTLKSGDASLGGSSERASERKAVGNRLAEERERNCSVIVTRLAKFQLTA